MTARQWQVVVEEVFDLSTGDVGVTATNHRGDEIVSGDAATVLGIDVREVVLQPHSHPGKLSLVLRGIAADAIQKGSLLEGRSSP